MTKVLAIIGVTGTQGSSVAKVFLNRPGFVIKGISRDPNKRTSQQLAREGVQIVQADIDDVESLKKALAGAHIVFGNTAYPAEVAMKPQGQKNAYAIELQQGKNIADAVASVDGLELFIWSSLSAATKWSHGRYSNVYHFDSKAHVVEYIHEQLPALAAKMSILQMGLFVDNWKGGPVFVPWKKAADDKTMVLSIPGDGDCAVPFAVPQDAGKYVLALTQQPTGTILQGCSVRKTWAEFVALWSKHTGVPARLQKVTVSEHSKLDEGAGFGEEIGEMYGYMVDVGYHGGDPNVVFSTDLDLELQPTSLEEYIKSENWTSLLAR